MMKEDKRRGWLIALLVVAVALTGLLVALALMGLLSAPAAPGASIQFDGRTIQLDGSHTYNVESVHSTTVYTDVTITTSAVTVTIWRK